MNWSRSAVWPARLAAALCALLLFTQVGHAACRPDVAELRGDWGQVRFSVEVVDTVETRARGLMFREYLPRSAGMLFLYDTPEQPVFWMRNTLIPLDMLFFGPDGVLAHLHHEAIPHDRTGIDGGPNIIAVLEINGGLARRLGIGPGTELRHPGIDQSVASWPCD